MVTRKTRFGVVAGLSITALLLGCLGPRVTVLPSSTEHVHAAPKAADCTIDFLRTKVERPYLELAALHAAGGDTFKGGPEDFHRALQAKACELGADAVLVTDDFSGYGGVMNVVAIKYRP